MKKFILDIVSLHLTAVLTIAPTSGFAQVAISEIGEKPSVNPGDNPSYNPSENDSSKLQIPSADSKPTGNPTEGSPITPDLTNVPFGNPGNVHFHDSTKSEKSDGPPSTTKLDLLDKHSDLDAEKVLGLNNDELAEIDKLLDKGDSGSDIAKKAVELADKVKSLSGTNSDQGKKVIQLITEKNLDHLRLEKLDAKSLNLIADLSVDGNLDSEKTLLIAENGGEDGLKLVSEKKLDLEKLSKRTKSEINLISNLGTDSTTAEHALNLAINGGEDGLKLVSEKKLDLEKLSKRSKSEIILISSLGLDSLKANQALKIAELGGEDGLRLVSEQNLDLLRLSNRAENEIKLIAEIGNDSSNADDVLSFIEAGDGFASTLKKEKLLSNLSESFRLGEDTGNKKVNKNKILSFSKLSNSSTKDLIFDKLSNTESAVNPIEQLVLLDPVILDKIGSVDKTTDELATTALNTLQSSPIASEVGALIPGQELDVHDINSVFNHYDKLEQTNLGGTAEFEEIREQIASIIVLDVVSDNFKIEIANPDGTETPVQAAVQFSDVAGTYGEAVLAEIEKLGTSSAIVEEMNELNPKLYVAKANGSDAHHNDVLKHLADNGIVLETSSNGAQRFRRATESSDSKSPLTLIKEYQRDAIIEDVMKDYGSTIPVSADAIKNILTPGDESEEHHHEAAMNSASHADFAEYIDDVVPDELEAVSSTGQASFTNQLSNLKNRLSNVRLAQMGFPASDGMVDAMVAKAMQDFEKEERYIAQANGTLTKDILNKVLSDEASELNNGFFAQASASFTEDELHKMDGDSWGVTFGVDQEIFEDFTFGVMGGFGKSDSSGDGTEVATDSIFAGVYSNWVRDFNYIDAFLTFGFHNSETSRTENSGAIMDASPNSSQTTVGITYGKVYEYKSFLITPSLGFTYNHFETGAYSESVRPGTDPFSTASSSQLLERRDESFVSSLGAKIAYHHFNPEGGVIIPEFRLSWEHDFNADPVNQGVHLLSHGADDVYYINGRPEDSDFGLIGTGITSIGKSGRSMFLHYDYMIGKDDFDAHFVNLGFRILF